jgi:hypothetical protein
MPKVLEPGARYSGRRADVAVLNCTVPRETVRLLQQYAGGKKLGAFIALLVQEYHGKQQERLRLHAHIQDVMKEAKSG